MGDILRNTFSWSVSRDSTFLECPRQYYYRYYGYWGGWEPDAPERVRRIYVLKQLTNRPMWIGQVVHECIKRSLDNIRRGIPVLPVEEILSITRDRMRSDFRDSRAGRYRENPKHVCGLIEHEYGRNVPDEQWREAALQVDNCLRNFYGSEVWDRLRRMRPDGFLEIEELSRIKLDDTEIIIKLDCAVRETDHIVIWDWKTGRRENPNPNLQMACYAYYAAHTYAIPIHHVVTRRFELFHGEVHEDMLGERALGELLGYIRGSVKDMLATLDDPERNTASEEKFARVPEHRRCRQCNFLDVCKPDLPSLGVRNPPG